MARPRSDEKRLAILTAATRLIAEGGLAATPTAAVSKRAKIAEGTLFTYFPTKDDLVNALYCHIKRELAEVLMGDYPHDADVRAQLLHVWERYARWGIAHPRQRKVLQQLESSERLTPDSIAAGATPFAAIEATSERAIRRRVLRKLPLPFVAALFKAAVETTITFMAKDPAHAAVCCRSGFETFWGGVARQ